MKNWTVTSYTSSDKKHRMDVCTVSATTRAEAIEKACSMPADERVRQGWKSGAGHIMTAKVVK